MVKIPISLRIAFFAFAQLSVFHSSGYDTMVSIPSKDKRYRSRTSPGTGHGLGFWWQRD
jgi:hypothetical protein